MDNSPPPPLTNREVEGPSLREERFWRILVPAQPGRFHGLKIYSSFNQYVIYI